MNACTAIADTFVAQLAKTKEKENKRGIPLSIARIVLQHPVARQICKKHEITHLRTPLGEKWGSLP